MSIRCTECSDKVYPPGLGIISAVLKGGNLKEGKGFIVCNSHFNEIKLKVHSLDDLADGDVVVLDERKGYVNEISGTLAVTQPTERVRILGYLTKEEAISYFPKTCASIYHNKPLPGFTLEVIDIIERTPDDVIH